MGVQSLVGKLRSHTPSSRKGKTQSRGDIVTNSIKTSKIIRIKKTHEVPFKPHIPRTQVSRAHEINVGQHSNGLKEMIFHET